MRPPHRNHRARLIQLSLWLLLLFGLPLCCRAAESDLDVPEELKLPSFWVKSFDLRAWSGYKDNVLLSDFNIIDSPFVAGGLDLMFYRLPVDGWEYLLLSSAEYVRYLSAPEVDQEATAIAQAQVTRTLTEDWKLGLSGDYVYFNQVLDSSAFPEVLTSVPLQGHGFTLRPSLHRNLGKGWWLELQVPGTRQLFDRFVDDYWETGPQLSFGRAYGRSSELTATYQFANRWHDTREPRDAAGLLEPGRTLQFYQHELSVAWRQHWDADRRWRTVTKVSLQRNEDNGGGYYDYWRPQISEQLRYQAKTWEIQAEARISYYHYDRQPIEDPGSPTREKTYLRFNLRAEKTLLKSLKAFVQFENEQALSNLDIDRYNANTVSAGVDWEF